MQVVGKVPDVGGERGRALLKGGHDLGEVGLRSRPAQAMLEAAQHHRQHREPLAEIVVQIAPDARPFRFLRGNQPAGEILILLIALSKLRLAVAQRAFDAPASTR